MRRLHVAWAASLLLTCACADLDVTRVDRPDSRRILTDTAEVEALVRDAYLHWWDEVNTWSTDRALLTASFSQSTIASCCGEVDFSWIPRRPIVNTVDWPYRRVMEETWDGAYTAARNAGDVILSLTADPPVRLGPGGADNARALAFAYFVHGLSHLSIAALFDQGVVLTPRGTETLELVSRARVLEAGMASMAEAVRISEAHEFTIPGEWLGNVPMDQRRFANLVRGYRARFRAAQARSLGERRGIDWNAVRADASALTESFVPVMDAERWWNFALIYKTFETWSSLGYHHYGMADQTGRYQEWLGEDPFRAMPFRIETPDLRYPQGSTDEAQHLNPGRYYARTTGTVGTQPGRGTWRWSWYRDTRNDAFLAGPPSYTGPTPELTVREMRLLMAEGAYYAGNHAEAAALVNETRASHGLNATDAGGLNTSCVPRLPDGRCGGLLEMIKWEKRHEVRNYGGVAGGYLDARGWGDLMEGTVLHLPVPAKDLAVLGVAAYSFGGPGGEGAALRGTYGW
jgi:hypothetical protein